MGEQAPSAAVVPPAQEAPGPGTTAYPSNIVQDRVGRPYRADEDAHGGNDESEGLLATEHNILAKRKRNIFGGAAPVT